MESASGAQIDANALILTASPVYVELVNDINSDINVVQAKMADLRAAHEARVRMTFDPAAEEQKDEEIRILTAEITRHFNLGGARLKKMSNFDSEENTEAKLRKNIQRGLATRLHDLSTEFRCVAGRSRHFIAFRPVCAQAKHIAILVTPYHNSSRKDQKHFAGTINKIRKGQTLEHLFGGAAGGACRCRSVAALRAP